MYNCNYKLWRFFFHSFGFLFFVSSCWSQMMNPRTTMTTTTTLAFCAARHYYVRSGYQYQHALRATHSMRQLSTEEITKHKKQKCLSRAYVAVGSNLGQRFRNIDQAISLLCGQDFKTNDNGENNDDSIQLLHTSMLHETSPMYVTDQPSFLNGMIEIETSLSPEDLLHRLKAVEAQLGRDLHGGIRNGPRPVDLDIIFFQRRRIQEESHSHNNAFDSIILNTPDLVIPHPRMAEREFVLAPLCEISSFRGVDQLQHPLLNNESVRDIYRKLREQQHSAEKNTPTPQRVVVLPLPRDRMLYFNKTVIMGILNVTPDSFSDGGRRNASLKDAVQYGLEMEKQGADIIDIGGESTRPGAKEIAVEEELRRTIPVIERIRNASDIPISIDTRHAAVAKAAIDAGADLVNDVSGGTFDADMLRTVAALRVPIVLMHMRGTPETMQTFTSDYTDIVQDVAAALNERCSAAEEAGIPRWMQIIDPGIGFAKDVSGNLSLLKNLNQLRSMMAITSTPLLLGTSRKGFIGKITGVDQPEDRDFASVASCIAAICLGEKTEDVSSINIDDSCNMLRMHNVKAAKEAAVIMDAIRRAECKKAKE